jgi:hypothetical protein
MLAAAKIPGVVCKRASAAAEKGYRVKYTLATRLVNELVEAENDNALAKTIARYGRVDLLCIDELGYMELDKRGAELLFQVLTEREEKASVATGSNESFSAVEERRSVIEKRLPSHEWPAADLRLVVVDAGTGAHRILTRDDGESMIDAVAASCAIPMVWPPIELDGRYYIDGGSRSPLNLDLAPGTGAVIALAPMTMSIKRAGSVSVQR